MAHVARALRRRPDSLVHLLLLGNARALVHAERRVFQAIGPLLARRCSLRSSSCLSFRASSKVMYGAQRSACVAYPVPQSQSSASATGALALVLVLVVVFGVVVMLIAQWFVCKSLLAYTPFYSHFLFYAPRPLF
jgi:hypothetical protein